MAEMEKVRLQRAYLWHDENNNEVSYGPGEVDIPAAMAAGLRREGVNLPVTAKEEDVHPKIFAQREADASEHNIKAAVKLAKKLGLDEQVEALNVTSENPLEQQVLRNEAIGKFLAELAKEPVETLQKPELPTDAAGPVTVETVNTVDASASTVPNNDAGEKEPQGKTKK